MPHLTFHETPSATSLTQIHPQPKQSSRMKHFCLPIPHHSHSQHSRSTSNKLQKRNSATSRSVDTRSTLRDSVDTLRTTNNDKSKRLSLRIPRSKKEFEDVIWRAYPAELEPFSGFNLQEDELNDTQGDCLVYFHTPGVKAAGAIFQLSSDKIRGANIAFLNDLLRAGCREAVANDRYTIFPRTDRLVTARKELKRHSQLLPMMRTFSPIKLFESTNNLNKRNSLNPTYKPSGPIYIEEDLDEEEEVEDLESVTIKYKLWFTVPATYDEEHKHDYQLAIRNLFAIIHKKSIVGSKLVQTLKNIQDAMDAFDTTTSRLRNGPAAPTVIVPDARLITSYMREMRLDDVRYDLDQALQLLAWTESADVRWTAGYLEIFVHAVGMMKSETFEIGHFRHLSHTTQSLLKNAFDALQLIIQETEDKLKDFNFEEMWTLADVKPKEHNPAAPQWHQHRQAVSARRAAEEFGQFILTYYKRLFGCWPPPSNDDRAHWLNRAIVNRLQTDMGLLYEYLVDKDITWSQMTAVYRREWEIVDKHNEGFRADQHAPVTDMLFHFDDTNHFEHIPHPFPLLPSEEMVMKRRSIFNALSVRSRVTESTTRMGLFAQARNTDLDREPSNFLDAFKQHEASFSSPGVSVQEARLGRWMLLYGILQSLSHLSVDVPGLHYTEDVDYFLCFGLNGHPPWASDTARSTVKMPSQEASYCWTAAERWYTPYPYDASIAPSAQRDSKEEEEEEEEEELASPVDSGIGKCIIDTSHNNKANQDIGKCIIDTTKANRDISFVMPSGSLIPAPLTTLRPSPIHTNFPASITSSSSITALPRIPERSSLRNSRMSMEQKRKSVASTGQCVSITPSLRSEVPALDGEMDKRKKTETLASMEGTEWADTEFSGEEATAVPLRSGVRGTLVDRAMSSRSTIEWMSEK